jgi:hypothetical protein
MTDFRTSGGMSSETIEDVIEYRSVEPWAILALVLGFLSPLAMLGTLWALVAGAGVLASLVALARIRADSGKIGRIVALSGLCLSVTFGVAPAAQWAASNLVLRNQPRAMADQFFEFLRQNQPEKAMMLRVASDHRMSLDDSHSIWLSMRYDQEAATQMQQFVQTSLIRKLLELGKRAEAKYYRTTVVATDSDRAIVDYVYTVTFTDDDGRKKTFLVGILMERIPTRKADISPWRVKDYVGDVDPLKQR